MTQVKVRTPFPGVIHLVYPAQLTLARAFMRMQEFYESNIEGFRGEHFTRDEFKRAYAESKGTGTGWGEFTYYDDWGGFNVPGNIVNKFLKVFHPDHSEVTLVNLIKMHRKPRGEYYVIGTYAQDEWDTVSHELSHAFWYLHPHFQEMGQELVDGLPRRFYRKAKKALLDLGYCEEVIDDEIMAYMGTSNMAEMVDVFETKNIPWKKALEFQEAFADYLEEVRDDQE